jgi:hypothetical protein
LFQKFNTSIDPNASGISSRFSNRSIFDDVVEEPEEEEGHWFFKKD